jgi:hypothetical protein
MLVVPATVLVERCWSGATVRRDVALALVVILAGVALSAPAAAFSSLASERPSQLGLVVALAAVLVTALAVILIGATQKQLAASPLALLDAQQRYIVVYAVAMACSFEDAGAMSQALLASPGTAAFVCASSVAAVLLNTTGFSVLSLLSPLSYQVVSQFKTVATLGLSVVVLGEPLSARQAAGFALSICGIAAYSRAKMAPAAEDDSMPTHAAKPSADLSEDLPLVVVAAADTCEEAAAEGARAAQGKPAMEAGGEVVTVSKE